MSNEPVAWMTKWGDGTWSFSTEPRTDEVCIPLYTHPAKTLTDEEILEVAKEMGWRGALGFLVRFARAILKKASEK